MSEKTGSFSRLSERCQKCSFRDDCENKRLEACAYIIPEQFSAPAMADLTMPIMAGILVKHDYRDVWIGPTTTITIDLEDVKRQLEKDFYKSMNCGFMNPGK